MGGEAGFAGHPAGFDRHFESAGHGHGVFGHRDGSVDQNGIGAEFERFGGVAGGAESGVDDDRNAGLFDDDGNLRAGFESAIASDG